MGSYDWVSILYNQATFVAFDTETTGLKPEESKVVEIGAVKFNKDGVLSRFSVLIDPECHMPEEAGAINHITDEMLKGKPLFKEIAKDFRVTAKAPDGIVEAIEYTKDGFMMGVQFHPEMLAQVHEASRKLFEELVKASNK